LCELVRPGFDARTSTTLSVFVLFVCYRAVNPALFKKKTMVLSYEEACKKMDKAEGVSKKITERYAYGRCYYLISIGKLKTAEFDLYIKTDQGFQDIGKQLTGFVTAESVDKLISEREPLLREKGITRKGMAIVAKFQDGTESTFLTKGECCKFFGIHPKDMKKYIGTKLAIQ